MEYWNGEDWFLKGVCQFLFSIENPSFNNPTFPPGRRSYGPEASWGEAPGRF
jgi:hypothetical protein